MKLTYSLNGPLDILCSYRSLGKGGSKIKLINFNFGSVKNFRGSTKVTHLVRLFVRPATKGSDEDQTVRTKVRFHDDT